MENGLIQEGKNLMTAVQSLESSNCSPPCTVCTLQILILFSGTSSSPWSSCILDFPHPDLYTHPALCAVLQLVHNVVPQNFYNIDPQLIPYIAPQLVYSVAPQPVHNVIPQLAHNFCFQVCCFTIIIVMIPAACLQCCTLVCSQCCSSSCSKEHSLHCP